MAQRSRRKASGNSRIILFILLLLVIFYLYKNPHLFKPSIEKPPTGTALPEPDSDTGNPKPASRKSTGSKPEIPSETTAGFAFEKDASFALPAHSRTDQVIRHTGYTLCYVEKYEQPSWVAYQLTDVELRGKSERENDFRPDPDVKTGSATPDDYRGSGYDRGHLAPAADFKSSPKLMSESFFMSNMSPQVPEFNRGVWEKLESRTRTWVKRDKVLYVVTGPVFGMNMQTIGRRNKVTVPPQYYKVLLDLVQPEVKAIAFLLNNEGTAKNFREFAVSIDEVEKATGLDFFPQLPDDLEKKLEGSVDTETWFKK